MHPNQDSNDVISRSFHINITVQSVDQETIHRLTTTMERVLRKAAVTVLIAKNITYSTRLDLTCAIIYPEPKKKKNVIDNISKNNIPTCFPASGMKLDGKHRKTVVTAFPIEPFDDSGFWNMRSVWSQTPWALIYAGPGAAADFVTVALREGSRYPLTFPKSALVRNLNSFIAETIVLLQIHDFAWRYSILIRLPRRIGTTRLGRPTRCLLCRRSDLRRVRRVRRRSSCCAAGHVAACRDDGSAGACGGCSGSISSLELPHPWGPAPAHQCCGSCSRKKPDRFALPPLQNLGPVKFEFDYCRDD